MILEEAFSAFEAECLKKAKKQYPDREAAQFVANSMKVLHRLIAWSNGHSDFMRFEKRPATGAKSQDRVTFYLLPEKSKHSTSPFWDAYPDTEPKVSFLVDPSRKADGNGWPPELQTQVKSRLETYKLLAPDAYPTVRFHSLTGERLNRDPLADLFTVLDEMIVAIKSAV